MPGPKATCLFLPPQGGVVADDQLNRRSPGTLSETGTDGHYHPATTHDKATRVRRDPQNTSHRTADSKKRREKPRPKGGRGARERPCGDPQETPPSHNPRQKPHGRNPSPTEHAPPHRADAPRPPGRTDFFFFLWEGVHTTTAAGQAQKHATHQTPAAHATQPTARRARQNDPTNAKTSQTKTGPPPTRNATKATASPRFL